MKYKYDVTVEQFRRVDGKGVTLPFNIVEARRIESMIGLGIKTPTILKKMDFVNDVSITNLRTFVANLEQGNILGLDNDYPMPTIQLEEIGDEIKYTELENRVKTLENQMAEIKSDCFCTSFANDSQSKGIVEKIRSWM